MLNSTVLLKLYILARQLSFYIPHQINQETASNASAMLFANLLVSLVIRCCRLSDITTTLGSTILKLPWVLVLAGSFVSPARSMHVPSPPTPILPHVPLKRWWFVSIMSYLTMGVSTYPGILPSKGYSLPLKERAHPGVCPKGITPHTGFPKGITPCVG